MSKPEDKNKPYGIRVSLPAGDPFASLVGSDWNTSHWFDNRNERDSVLRDMSREHEYSRGGDKPALVFEAIDRPAA